MLSPTNRIIQGLWVGPKLSAMERMSISSFLQNGHDYHLYVYEEVKEIPPGTIVRDGNEILPASLQVEQMADESYRSGQTGLPAYLQTLQAARDVRQRALQAALDELLALADLERAMGSALK